jgi:DHA1 family bicyclomycin/chloramphenicol resistance-like MFS transporter
MPPIVKQSPGPLFALALAAISLIGPLAVHLFLPVIPAVKAALALSSATAQLTFSIALFSMAIATLFYGSLSDRYGRRPVLLSGLVLFLIGSALSALASSILLLVLGRCVQAIGAGCGLTLGRAIAQDVYGPGRLIKAIAYLTMAYTLGPMLAPIIGGALIDAFGWRSVFGLALVLGGAIAALAYGVVFESHPPRQPRARGDGLLADYGRLFGNLRFSAFVLQSGFSTGSFMVTATAASSLMKETLHQSSTSFGVYFVLFPIGLLCGNVVTSRIGSRVANETMVLAGSLLSITAVATQSALILTGHLTILTLFAPGFFITFAQGISLSYAQAGAMSVNPKLAGTAAGIGVFVQNFCGAAFAQLFGLVADGTARPLTETTALSAALCLAAGTIPFVMARSARPKPSPQAGI